MKLNNYIAKDKQHKTGTEVTEQNGIKNIFCIIDTKNKKIPIK